MAETEDPRHLFISYATENHELADWLSLRLAAEGYEVWYDRIKLLGGESYPKDIDDAIKNKTFRVLHLLSRVSIRKDNPVKERTLALNIARERAIDFLIPLNVDGLRATELPWMTADLTYIPFLGDWAGGLDRLLKKLDSIGAPKRPSQGRDVVRRFFADQGFVQPEPEPIWSNVVEVLEFPKSIYRITPRPGYLIRWNPEPIFFSHGGSFWTLEQPAETADLDIERFDCDPDAVVGKLPLLNPITNLVSGHLIRHARRRGLKFTGRRSELYFPPGLAPNDRLSFEVPGSRRSWTAATGERTFLANRQKEKSRYHLSFELRPVLRVFDKPVVEVQMAVWLTNLSGNPLDAATSLRRRKRICRDWWNYEWLARTFATLSWLASGQGSFEVFRRGQDALVISGRPFALRAPVRLDESQLEVAPSADDSKEIDDSPDLEDDDDENGSDGYEDSPAD